jgi:hypothetical protein
MNQELIYNHRRQDIFRRITYVRCNSMIMMLLLIMIVMIGQIDHEKLGKAQSDIMSHIIVHIHPQLSLLVFTYT